MLTAREGPGFQPRSKAGRQCHYKLSHHIPRETPLEGAQLQDRSDPYRAHTAYAQPTCCSHRKEVSLEGSPEGERVSPVSSSLGVF